VCVCVVCGERERECVCVANVKIAFVIAQKEIM